MPRPLCRTQCPDRVGGAKGGRQRGGCACWWVGGGYGRGYPALGAWRALAQCPHHVCQKKGARGSRCSAGRGHRAAVSDPACGSVWVGRRRWRAWELWLRGPCARSLTTLARTMFPAAPSGVGLSISTAMPASFRCEATASAAVTPEERSDTRSPPTESWQVIDEGRRTDPAHAGDVSRPRVNVHQLRHERLRSVLLVGQPVQELSLFRCDGPGVHGWSAGCTSSPRGNANARSGWGYACL